MLFKRKYKKNIKFEKYTHALRLDYQNFMIFFTFLLFWISIQFGQIIEDSIAYVIILSIGIIHGSNDFTILKKQQKDRSNYLKSTLFYLFLILLCLGSYWINSFVSILFFIILSSYHFGEQHLENKVSGTKFVNTIVYFTYGLLIFSLIFIENLEDVDLIMSNLTGVLIPKNIIFGMLIFSVVVLGILYLYHLIQKTATKIHIIKELFYLLLLYLVFRTTSLTLGFAIYFVLWHSIPSIIDQTKFLSGSHFNESIISYIKTALLYWIISISGLLMAYVYLSENYFNSIIFLVLFAVTAPHVWVMYRMRE